MDPKPLPPPEWFEEFRLLHVGYGEQYDAIRQLDIPEDEKRFMAGELWSATEQHRKRLMKSAVTKLRCTGTKPDGSRCTRPARPDYFGQKCNSHAPHLQDYPSIEEIRASWQDHEYNRTTTG